jgi:chaperonin GroES
MSEVINPTAPLSVGAGESAAPQAIDLSGKRLEDLPRYFEPYGDYLLVQPLPPEEITKGGIILVEKNVEPPAISVLVAKGPDAGRYEEGDWLSHAPFVGQHLQLGATKFLVFREEEVLGRLVERERP